MGDSDDGSKAASPYSTGGGGTRLEHRFGTHFLVRLLTGGSISALAERAPASVAFQQSPATTVDDLVLTAPGPDGISSVRLAVAVRRNPTFTRSDETTSALVSALVSADLRAERADDPSVDLRLAVGASRRSNSAREVADLATVARGQLDSSAFFELVNTPGKFATSGRLAHFRDMVSAALTALADPNAGTPEHRSWSLLRRLSIIQMDLEADDEADWSALISDVKPLTLDQSAQAAVALRDRIEQLSGEFAQIAAIVDAPLLRRRLHGEIIPDAHMRPAGWQRLLSLDKEARAGVTRSLAPSAAGQRLALPRAAVRDELKAAIEGSGNLMVKGDSGVGKSALAMDAVDPAELGADRQAIILDLRHLPDNQLELIALLSDPLEELFRELTAPDRMVVIDGAEAASEAHGQVFSHVVRCAREAGLKVIVIAATEGAGAATELLKAHGASEPREYVVPGLNDAEIAEAAAHFPELQRLAANPRARELLRRPIVVDLLGRAGDPGLPLSESDALDHVWQHLVRGGSDQRAGSAASREQVMLRLAAHALQRGDVDDLLMGLDNAAVEGLRRSGLIRADSGLPWDRVPDFKHDLLRAYSIARYLLRDRDPAATLTAVGAPRWALPAARLACEVLLSAPDEPAHPLAGRFAQLQMSFAAIASAGHGERWADLPSESLLVARDPSRLFEDAWSELIRGEHVGLARVIRILHGRHQPGAVLDARVAEPVIARLIEQPAPSHLAEETAELIRNWLWSHVILRTGAGQPTRGALREAILGRCAENERKLDELDAAREAELATRTPDQVAADEKRRRAASVASPWPSRRRRRRPAPRHRPYEWIANKEIEWLSLLGPDLGSGGEAVLRRIAADGPHLLEHAVETLFAGQSLASYNPQLLLDLAGAYYIEDEEEDDDGFGWSGGLGDDGIRDHRFHGGFGPLGSFTHGPFLAMVRADYRGAIGLVNRMLNHAARYRVRTLSSLRYGPPDEDEVAAMKVVLSITGAPHDYVGDGHVWLWYRGTGVGPYPCMSALQALEFVTEELISAGVPADLLASIMLEGADNLAMPALALSVLVRHLETVGAALDAYLVEPAVWQLEFSRTVHEHGMHASRSAELEQPERRSWSLREVAAMLTLQADGDRIDDLKSVGERLIANAVAQVADDDAVEARQHLAAVRNWAAALDRGAYQFERQGDQILVQQRPDPDSEQILRDTNDDLRRTNEAVGLIVRHAHVRDHGGRAPDIAEDVLAADLAIARDLFDNPPESSLGASPDGPVAVAATAIELHLTGRLTVSAEDLTWSASVLLEVAADVAAQPAERDDESFFDQGADRSSARAVPFLLLPEAANLRRELGVEGADELAELVGLGRALATAGVSEVRLAFSRALDAVWAAPCASEHLFGQCHHEVAYTLVTESFLNAVMGPWDGDQQRRNPEPLEPPEASALANVSGDDIYVRMLSPAIRALGAAAASAACCKEEAMAALDILIAAHQRGMLAFEHGYHHGESESLIVARAALWQSVDGRDGTVLAYVGRYLENSRLLAEGLRAIGTAAEERAERGQEALRLWPQIMDAVLDAAEADPGLFAQRTWGDYAESALVPNPSTGWGYLTLELIGDAHRWRDLTAWVPQVDRWCETATATRMSVDHLVTAVHELDVATQLDLGLKWIERIVERAGSTAGDTYTLPEWLRERRADLVTEEQTARWQRVVDLLVVAGDSRVADLAD